VPHPTRPPSRREFLGGATLAGTAAWGACAQTQLARPNILFCISDDQSHPHASAYGARFVHTPNFDRVAREGVLFTNAFSPSPGCSPTRAAVLTGRHDWQIEQAGTHASSFPARYETYPDLLERAGYRIGYTGKGWGPGNWDEDRPRNPAGPEFNVIETDPGHEGIRRTDYAENFNVFLDQRPAGEPFCFWYGASEPHRVFQQGVGLASGKRLEDVDVPPFLPDTTEIRSDMLDYAFEIEHFDAHLGRILDALEQTEELENTLVIVTSDNGMAFPRAKANCYEFGIHMPLAIRWGDRVPARRTIDDLIGFVDLTATILDAAGVDDTVPASLSGRSILDILESEQEGTLDPARDAVYSSRERHSSSRYDNWTYPQRSIRTRDYLYIRNFKPDRWPAGAPQKYEEDGTLGPMHGGYHDIDACPTLDYLIENRDDPEVQPYFLMAVDKRSAEELFDIHEDPGCLVNLADEPAHEASRQQLANKLEAYLRDTGDPRVVGDGDIWETYKRYSPIRTFPEPPESL
jgi:N-sulfoglucosamine sulfohydrolase